MPGIDPDQLVAQIDAPDVLEAYHATRTRPARRRVGGRAAGQDRDHRRPGPVHRALGRVRARRDPARRRRLPAGRGVRHPGHEHRSDASPRARRPRRPRRCSSASRDGLTTQEVAALLRTATTRRTGPPPRRRCSSSSRPARRSAIRSATTPYGNRRRQARRWTSPTATRVALSRRRLARTFELSTLELPIVQAPMAGGPSTPALAIAVCRPAGSASWPPATRAPMRWREDIAALRAATGRAVRRQPVRADAGAGRPALSRVTLPRMTPEAERQGVGLGEPRSDDDDWEAKLELVARRAAGRRVVHVRLPGARGVSSACTRAAARPGSRSPTPRGARGRTPAGADALVVQGTEAGGHRGVFATTATQGGYGLLALLRLVAQRDRPAADRHRRDRTARPSPPCCAPAPRRRRSGPRSCSRPRRPRDAAPRGAGRRPADAPDARVHRPHGPRDRQPLPGRALTTRAASPTPRSTTSRPAARRRPQARRRRRLQPVGGPGARARPGPAGRASSCAGWPPRRARSSIGSARPVASRYQCRAEY